MSQFEEDGLSLGVLEMMSRVNNRMRERRIILAREVKNRTIRHHFRPHRRLWRWFAKKILKLNTYVSDEVFMDRIEQIVKAIERGDPGFMFKLIEIELVEED